MRLFERSGGHWLFWTGVVYFVIGMVDVFLIKSNWSPWIQVAWLAVIGSPFLVPPLGRWLNLDVTWDKSMFDWFDKTFRRREYTNDQKSDLEKIGEDMSKVIPFPETVKVPPMPEVQPPAEKPAKIFYRLGLTDNNRVSFQMGYSEITMNSAGCQQMIDQLEFFKNQLREEEDDNSSGT